MSDYEKAIGALDRLPSWMCDDRERWIHVGFALHSVEQSERMLGHWKRWSSGSEKFNERECDRQWRTMRADKGTGIGTLLMWANGDTSHRPAQPRARPARKPQGWPTREDAISALSKQIGRNKGEER